MEDDNLISRDGGAETRWRFRVRRSVTNLRERKLRLLVFSREKGLLDMVTIGSAGAEHKFESLDEAQAWLNTLQAQKKMELTVVIGEGIDQELMKLAFDPFCESLDDVLERAKDRYLENDHGVPTGEFVEKKRHMDF